MNGHPHSIMKQTNKQKKKMIDFLVKISVGIASLLSEIFSRCWWTLRRERDLFPFYRFCPEVCVCVCVCLCVSVCVSVSVSGSKFSVIPQRVSARVCPYQTHDEDYFPYFFIFVLPYFIFQKKETVEIIIDCDFFLFLCWLVSFAKYLWWWWR